MGRAYVARVVHYPAVHSSNTAVFFFFFFPRTRDGLFPPSKSMLLFQVHIIADAAVVRQGCRGAGFKFLAQHVLAKSVAGFT